MTDKTQEELEKIVDNIFNYLEVGESGLLFTDEEHRYAIKKVLTHYINKYYVPKGDLETFTLEEVEKIIGEDEDVFDSQTPGMVDEHEEDMKRGKNQLRAEQRQHLKETEVKDE